MANMGKSGKMLHVLIYAPALWGEHREGQSSHKLSEAFVLHNSEGLGILDNHPV